MRSVVVDAAHQRNRQVAVAAVKRKVIEEFCKILKRLQKGYKEDYSKILLMISYINFPEHVEKDKNIVEYLLNVRP